MIDEELVKHCMCGCMYLEAECPNCNKVTDADRIEALTAKLAKAVEALRLIEADCEADYPPSHLAIKYAARSTLAEIEGDKG
jgi:hypothetical protein